MMEPIASLADVARVAYEADRVLRRVAGQSIPGPWEQAGLEQRDTYTALVHFARQNDAQILSAKWLEFTARGLFGDDDPGLIAGYGEALDALALTAQRRVMLFLAVVNAVDPARSVVRRRGG